jgi:hypothetical protein
MSINPDDGARRASTATTPATGRFPVQQGAPPQPMPDPPVVQQAPPADPRTEVIDTRPDRREVLDQQKQRFGGIKWGSAFFGWLTAVGTAVLVTALITAIGGAIGLSAAVDAGQAADQAGQAAQNPGAVQTAGIVSAIVAAAVLFLAYYCGGYVAGRMARFSGMKQGVAVWIWTIVITVVVAVLIAVAGAQFNVLGTINGLPQLPVSGDALSTAGIITALVALAVSLAGAVLGGLAGMRFHRKIDRADLDDGLRTR